MSPLEQVVLASHCLWKSMRLLARPSLWAPWLPVVAVQLGVVAALWGFAHPTISWLVAPVLQKLAGEPALHYPESFRFMPALYARADILITAGLGAIAIGGSTAMFGALFEGRPMSGLGGLRRGWSRAWALVGVNLPLTVFVLGFSYGLDAWLQRHEGAARMHQLAPGMVLMFAVVLQAFFLWVNPLVVLGGRRPVEAWRDLPEAVRHGGWAALTLAGAAAIPLIPLQALVRATDVLVQRGTPELVGWWVVGQVLLAAAAAFVLAGGSTLSYVSLVGPELEGEA